MSDPTTWGKQTLNNVDATEIEGKKKEKNKVCETEKPERGRKRKHWALFKKTCYQ